jgi:hypothetical protein
MRVQGKWGIVKFSRVFGLVTAASLLMTPLVVSGSAQAYTGTPPWVATDGAKGGVQIWDALGNQIYSGSDIHNFAAYVSTSATAGSGASKAQAAAAVPNHTAAAPYVFDKNNLPNNLYSFTTATGIPTAVSANGKAFVKLNASGADPVGQVGTINPDLTTGYVNTLEIRVADNATGNGVSNLGGYYRTVIEYNDTASPVTSGSITLQPGAWTVVYPAAPVIQVATSLADLTPSPASGATAPVSLSLSTTVSATDSSHPAGSVHFFDGVNDLGAASSWDAATGAVTITGLTPSVGSHSYTAVFTPTDSATYAPSTSNALTYSVVAGSSTIATAVSAITPSTPTNSNAPVVLSLSATVTATDSSHPAGSVNFFDGSTDLGTAVFTQATGAATISGLSPAVGSHSYTAVFTPSDLVTYVGSTSPALSYTVKPAAPTNSGKPGISGSAKVGGTLTCSNGTWTGSPSLTKVWLDNGVQFATGPSSGIISASRLNHNISCRVTATNAGGSLPADSSAAHILKGDFVYTTKPSITGSFKVKKTLTAQPGRWNPSVTPTYQWKRGSVVISRAKTYKLVAKDKGKVITLVVTVKRTGYNDKSVSVYTKKIG